MPCSFCFAGVLARGVQIKLSPQQENILESLGTKEVGISTSDLAKELHIKPDSAITQLHRLKGDGLVTNTDDGWTITDEGKEYLATPRVAEDKTIRTLEDVNLTRRQVLPKRHKLVAGRSHLDVLLGDQLQEKPEIKTRYSGFSD